MRNILSCFVIFFLGFGGVACATQRNVIVAANLNLVGFGGGSEAENRLLPVAANAAQRRQLAHLVAVRNQVQKCADAFFFKVSVQTAHVNALARVHKPQDAHDVAEELAFVDEQHVGFAHFVGVTRFQLFNGGAHDARNHGAVVRGKERVSDRRVSRVARKINHHHAHVAKGALLVQIGEPRGLPRKHGANRHF